ncbi:MAG: hypothetical protein J5875_02345, partial [Paludibacteraceae bacterium]|nr:hypothetical protein [Paludibacteraceae bacterium]
NAVLIYTLSPPLQGFLQMKLKISDKRHIKKTAGDIASCFFILSQKVISVEEPPASLIFPGIF